MRVQATEVPSRGSLTGRRVDGAGPRRQAAPALAILALALMSWSCAGQQPEPAPGPRSGPEAERPAEAEPETRPEPTSPNRYYWTYVASDGADVVSRIRFGPGGAVFEKAIQVGSIPDEPDGIGELALSRDGSHWFLAVAGGPTPGSVWKYETGSDRMTGRVQLDGSPASVSVAPDGQHAYVTVGPRGGPGPAAVSVLQAARMAEAARISTCRGAAASRVHPDGRWQYSVCQEDDVLVEVSTSGPRVSRTVRLASDSGRCGPSDLALTPDGDRLYVACGEGRSVLTLDRDELKLRERMPLEGSPVAVAAGPDGETVLALLAGERRLVVLGSGGEEVVARIPLAAPRPSSVAVSDDGLYAFVTLRGRSGAPRGTVQVVDLTAMTGVATIEVPEGASAAAFWRSVEAKR